ncbi:hypothetical protein PFICI_04344 [Pestalotiopsis fici W106-1]|uniref:Uncharacterized protein n=1 Tax=Pestalotiopsis fici (strain W106-1 / CGMCC3.15140) TaxID=1229662 RepID=W3X8L8_PESFW|nr:uncharacterized protein PFICI_04344 [Pestalotiopsis fici W106-1]ETS82468.1 hypothetical protein PFICI_04344 [Pestalotiopsis fici W106-1]
MSRSLDISRTKSFESCTRSNSDSHLHGVKEWQVNRIWIESSRSGFVDAQIGTFGKGDGSNILERLAERNDSTNPSAESLLRIGHKPPFSSNEPVSHQSFNYRPSPLRDWYQGVVFIAIITLLCLTAVAVGTLPNERTTFAPFIEVEPTNKNSVKNRGLAVVGDYKQSENYVYARYSVNPEESVGSDLMRRDVECTTTVYVGKSKESTTQDTTAFVPSYTGAYECVQVTLSWRWVCPGCTGDSGGYINIGSNTITVMPSTRAPTNVASTAQVLSGATATRTAAVPPTTEISTTRITSQSKSETKDPQTSKQSTNGGEETTRNSVLAATESNGALQILPSGDVGTSEVSIDGSMATTTGVIRTTMINGSPTIITDSVRTTINSGSLASMTDVVQTTVIDGLTATMTGGVLTAVFDGSLTTIVDASQGLSTNVIDALVRSTYTTAFTNSDGTLTTQLVYVADILMGTLSGTLTGSQGSQTRSALTLITDFPASSSVSPSSSSSPTTPPLNSDPGYSGSPTDTNASSGTPMLQVYVVTEGQYFVGLFLPTLLTTFLAIPLRIMDFNIKLYRPFHNLLSKDGTEASRSLLLPTTGLSSYFRASDKITRLTGALITFSAILIPISAEAVHMVLHRGDGCQSGQGNAYNCAMTLGASTVPAYITIALLLVMGILIISVWYHLRNYHTGIPGKPWNLAFMSSFSSDPKIQSLVLSKLCANAKPLKRKDLLQVLDPWLYIIESQTKATSGCKVAIFDKRQNQGKDERKNLVLQKSLSETKVQSSKARGAPSFVLTPQGRILILLFITGVFCLVVAYEPERPANGFENFMNSIAWLSPYKIASRELPPALAQKTLELTLPTNPFSGLYRAISGSHPDAYLGIVSLVAILAQALPTLLVNVPFRMVETYKTHEICLWSAGAVMAAMICTVVGSFFVELPRMAVDPSTVAGAMYYATVDRTVYHNKRDYQKFALWNK